MDNRIAKKQTLIPTGEISLSQPNYALAYGNNYKLTAKIENHSKDYRLQAVNLLIEFSKCLPKQENQCVLIKTERYEVKTRLAAGQSTNIEKYIMLDDLETLQNNEVLQWNIKLLSGVAR